MCPAVSQAGTPDSIEARVAHRHMEPRTLDGPDDDENMQQFGEAQKRIPHYALPNVAAILPDFANMEQETIM